MSAPVTFPDMRLQVVAALRSLSDVPHQQARWARVEEGVDYYDDLTLNVHILYDDCAVLPEPGRSVGTIIYPQEVPALRRMPISAGRVHQLWRPDQRVRPVLGRG